MNRSCGILLHIASLPCKYGIGALGKPARDFVDYLAAGGQTYWQVLPLVPTGYGDSPYQSCCAYAGSEYFIDLDILASQGLLTAEELAACETDMSCRVDYAGLFNTRFDVLRKAFSRFDAGKDFEEFAEKGMFSDYALYRALKDAHGQKPWIEWEENYRFRDPSALAAFAAAHKTDLLFWEWTQYEFFRQWQELKTYANGRGIGIIGDMPIYVAYDSVECWTRPELVKLDERLVPAVVAGCPPDAFSATGQLWGNPVYDWERMAADGFAWWKNRLQRCFEIYDVVRIDHFRGFDRYYEIPFGETTAVGGHWAQGPSSAMFGEIENCFGKMEVIAEDLGELDDSAREMFRTVGYPGMKVLQFAFGSGDGNEYLPHNYTSDNCIAYTGTHDNDTLLGFISKLGDRKEDFRAALGRELAAMGQQADITNDEKMTDAIIALCYISKAKCAIIPLQDWLKIGGEGRINMPSTLSTDNWSYRVPAGYAEIAGPEVLRALAAEYNRIQLNSV